MGQRLDEPDVAERWYARLLWTTAQPVRSNRSALLIEHVLQGVGERREQRVQVASFPFISHCPGTQWIRDGRQVLDSIVDIRCSTGRGARVTRFRDEASALIICPTQFGVRAANGVDEVVEPETGQLIERATKCASQSADSGNDHRRIT